MGTPPAEVTIDEQLIARLIETQAPEFADLPVRIVAHGWDNVTARLGDEYAARLPRRELGATLTGLEQRWLPELAALVDIPVPAPVFVGQADLGYPWAWSIVPWIEGDTAERSPLGGAAAPELASFLAALHIEAPQDAPASPYRGSPLGDHTAGVVRRWEAFREVPAVADHCDAALAIWHAGADGPAAADRRWGHGDLHPRNVLSIDGRLAGVIDWGDLNAGDRSTDLAGVWMLLEPRHHDDFWRDYVPVDAATRRRGRAWAIGFAGMFIGTGLDDDPGFLELGFTVLDRVLAID